MRPFIQQMHASKHQLRGKPSQPQLTFAAVNNHTSPVNAAIELSPRLSGCPLGSSGDCCAPFCIYTSAHYGKGFEIYLSVHIDLESFLPYCIHV